MRIGVVVNSAGLQERRAAALADRLPSLEVSGIEVAPSPQATAALVARSDVLYVIDAGKRGATAAALAQARGRIAVVELGDPQAALYRASGRGKAAELTGWAVDRAVTLGATGIIVRGRRLKDDLDVRRPWMFLPDGVDLDVFRPLDATAARTALGIAPEALVAGVVGSLVWSPELQWAYGLDIIEAIAARPEVPVHALIVGDGNGRERLEARAAQLGVADRVTFTGRVDHARVPALLSAMDVCVSTQTNDPIGAGRTTAKLPEYLACDRFVLSTRVGTAARLLPETMLLPYAGASDPGHVGRLATRLTDLARDVAAIRARAGTRAIAEAHFSYDALAARLEAFVLDLAARR